MGILAILSVIAVAFWLALSAAPAAAQDTPQEEPFVTWDRTAEEAERLLEQDGVSPEVLQRLRDTLAEQRDEAFEMANEGSVRAKTLQAQMDSLGTPPLEGEPEAEDVAARRAELSKAIAEANAPVLDAREALERSEILISELDRKIRAAGTKRLLERSPTPLLPVAWAELPGDLTRFGDRFLEDVAILQSSEAKMAALRAGLPSAMIFAAIGILLVLVVEPLVTSRLVRAREHTLGKHRRRALAVTSLFLRLLIPLAGLALTVFAPAMITPDLPRMRSVASMLTGVILFLMGAHILGGLLFSPARPKQRILRLDDGLARRGYWLSHLLGIHLAIKTVLDAMEADYTFAPGSQSVLAFLVILTGIYPLYRLGTFLMATVKDDEASDRITVDVTILFGRFLKLAAVLAGIFASLGFVNLAREALEPAILTAALAAAGIYLRTLIVTAIEDMLGIPTADEEEGAILLPMLVSSLIFLGALPLLAMTWGARTSDISEVWRLLTAGVEVGDTRISITTVITLIAVFLVGLVVTRWIQRLLRQTFLPRTKLDRGAQSSIVTGVGYVGITLAALIAVSSAGLNLSSLAVVAGALSVGIGFGMQNIVSNFVSGIILLIERPVQEGDWIEVSGYSGYVRKIAVRSTRIETFDRFDVIIPNADLIAGTVKNMTLMNRDGRLVLPVGVAYGSDLQKVKSILLEVTEGRADIMKDPAPTVLFTGLGESSLDFELRCYLPDVGTTLTTRSELLFDIYTKLTEAGIEIPFPQRDVSLKGIEKLTEAIRMLSQKNTGHEEDKPSPT
ncbi:DUF3772 domain-containing protein [Ostreiculturibacter nitratireducens]|uniref:DUF3772 domain-containing protein n=1 Tax=Ostreiculturibacter nitratireducens TaxID=3075226 RepID=UPI0031B63551